MPRPRKKIQTRQKTELQIAGGPSELTETEPPTYCQIIRYFYFLRNTKNVNKKDSIKMITSALLDIWGKVNPRLPLKTELNVFSKLKYLINKVCDCNNNRAKISDKILLENKMDCLFDISSCDCELEIYPCNHRLVSCRNEENCESVHVVCICPSERNVPKEDRLYLKDQRAKRGEHGLFQLSSVDKTALPRVNTIHRDEQIVSPIPEHFPANDPDNNSDNEEDSITEVL